MGLRGEHDVPFRLDCIHADPQTACWKAEH
jgi:hypothetical protein